ncbi:hypothetical protein FKM82_016828 [Ascaphus truei]
MVTNMVTKASKSSPSHKHLLESYEDKHERRLEFHEILRSRYNVTSCRRNNPNWIRDQEREERSPRQQEFFRRRQLWSEDQGDKRVRSPPKSQKYLRYSSGQRRSEVPLLNKYQESPGENQFSWLHNCSSPHPPDCEKILPDCLDSNHGWGHLYARINQTNVSRTERGVQTIQDSSRICIKRDASQQTDCATAVLDGELQQLSEYLMEALHRERKLKKKLCVLQELLNMLIHTSETSWKAQLDEDKLKCKVAVLENKLFLYSQNYPKTSVKKILLEMEEQKQRYEEKAKESLHKLTEDKLAAERHLQNTQRTLSVSADECDLWKEEYERLKGDWSELTSKHCELKNELHVLQSKLQWVEVQDSQLQQFQHRLQSLERERIELQAWNDVLQEDNGIMKGQLNSTEVRLRNAEEQKLVMEIKQSHLQNELLALKQRSPPSLVPDPGTLLSDHMGDDDAKLQSDRLQLVVGKLSAREKECEELQSEVEMLSEEYLSCQRKLRQCREELKGNHRPKRNASGLLRVKHKSPQDKHPPLR